MTPAEIYLRDEYEERAAILEFCANYSREESEALARDWADGNR